MDKFALIDDMELGDEALDRQAPEAGRLCRCPFSVPAEPGAELTDTELDELDRAPAAAACGCYPHPCHGE